MERRHPQTFRFLYIAGPAVAAIVYGAPNFMATLAQGFPKLAPWAEKLFWQWWPTVTAGWFIALCVLVIVAYIAALVFTGWPTTPIFRTEAQPMVDQSVTSINQSGGITAGTVNFSKPVRLVTPAFEVELREKIPNKSKQIVIGCDWGNAEANRYATQIWQVLKSLGYNAGDGITQYSTPANAPLVISWGENSADAPVQITVGNND